jgi:hypothetical protein
MTLEWNWRRLERSTFPATSRIQPGIEFSGFQVGLAKGGALKMLAIVVRQAGRQEGRIGGTSIPTCRDAV